MKYKTIEEELEKAFAPRTRKNNDLILSYQRLGYEQKAKNVMYCGTELEFLVEDPPKLYRANFCKDRLCPMCGWRRTRKIFGQVSQVMDQIQDKYNFIFVTLTMKNCSAEDLKKTVDELQQGFNRFTKQTRVKKAFKGYFKALEITRNKKALSYHMEFHPHLHCIFAVNKSYFTGKEYISHEDLMNYWKTAINTEYLPSVRIQKIQPKKGEEKDNLKKAVAEVAKYTIKSTDFLTGTNNEIDRTVYALTGALTSRRLCAFGGIFRTIAQELDLDDINDGDLTLTDQEKELNQSLTRIIAKYKWFPGYGYKFIDQYEEKNENQRSDS